VESTSGVGSREGEDWKERAEQEEEEEAIAVVGEKGFCY
jgi:hypothetical protein